MCQWMRLCVGSIVFCFYGFWVLSPQISILKGLVLGGPRQWWRQLGLCTAAMSTWWWLGYDGGAMVNVRHSLVIEAKGIHYFLLPCKNSYRRFRLWLEVVSEESRSLLDTKSAFILNFSGFRLWAISLCRL